jgi:hypothetical protein
MKSLKKGEEEPRKESVKKEDQKKGRGGKEKSHKN